MLLHSFRTVWIFFNNVTFLIRITMLMKSYQQIFIDSLKSGFIRNNQQDYVLFHSNSVKSKLFFKTIYSLFVRSGCNIILKCKHVMLLLKQITNLHMRRILQLLLTYTHQFFYSCRFYTECFCGEVHINRKQIMVHYITNQKKIRNFWKCVCGIILINWSKTYIQVIPNS